MRRCLIDHKAAAGMAAVAIVALLAAPPAGGQHTHSGGAHTLSLDAGKKWATDASLRQGMTAIRDAVAADRRAIDAGSETAEQYRALAEKIDAQIASIVQHCKLAPAADAQLHVLLSDLVGGSEQMKSSEAAKRRQGAASVVGALDAYPRYFEHPGWSPLH